MKTITRSLLCIAALVTIAGCAGSAPEESEDVESTAEPVIAEAAEAWGCRQTCADGSWSMGFGNTPDEAYQNMPGCGPGGGTIYCQQGILQ